MSHKLSSSQTHPFETVSLNVLLSLHLISHFDLLGFQARTGEMHRKQCYQWKDLQAEDEQDEFFAKHGVRWTELARLPYFDIIRCSMIDPMHNLLLGKLLRLKSLFSFA